MRRNRLTGDQPGAPSPIHKTKKCAPIRCRCSKCGKFGKRQRTRQRTVRDLAHKQPALLTIVYGVYLATCACAKYFSAVVDGVALRWGYTEAVRKKVVDLLVRDHLSVYKVQQHLSEDFRLEVSVGFVHDCFRWAYQRIDRAAYWAWVLKNFSGVLCIDEVHDSGRTILVATDPVNDLTVLFLVVPENSQRNMNRFLDLLKRRGLNIRVAISDGSPLYKKALVERWSGLEHQLCVFHFLKDQMTDILKALRSIRDHLPANVSHRRGRPSRRGRPRKHPRWRRNLLNDNMHLVIKKPKSLSRHERRILRDLYRLDGRIRLLHRFTQRLHMIFAASSAQAARNLRTRILRDRAFQRSEFLQTPLRRLADDALFETLIVSLSWHRVPRTNNHVERKNRAFRLVQKTRYKRRLPHMIRMAYWLHLQRDWQLHPLMATSHATPFRIRRRRRKRKISISSRILHLARRRSCKPLREAV